MMIKKLIKLFKKIINFYKIIFALLALVSGLIIYFNHNQPLANWIMGTVAIAECLPLIKAMWQDIRIGKYGIDILALTAVIVSVLLRQDFAAILVIVMLTGGSSLEDYAENRAKSELSQLLANNPKTAHLVKAKKIIDVKLSKVNIGDKLIIKPGEIVPVNSIILEGGNNFDESSISGESLEVYHTVGDMILSGSVNGDQSITVKVIADGEHSEYQTIIKLVRTAQSSKAPFVRLADKYSIPFTIVAYALAVFVWIISGKAIRFLDVIIVATPCPLLLAAPIALVSGMSKASKNKIIVKSGSSLEKLAMAQTIIFDKTGTLTTGQFVVENILIFNKKYTKNKIIELAAGLEQNSNHIIAKSLIQYALEAKIKIGKIKKITEHRGLGLSGIYKGNQIYVGNLNFMEKNKLEIKNSFLENQSYTTIFIAIDKEIVGRVDLSDEPRTTAKSTIKAVRGLGINDVVMITGDNDVSAQSLAKKLAIKTVYSEALPSDKLIVLQNDIKNRPAIFVGDGVNDAPILAGADIGIALATKGATAATDSADVLIMNDDLTNITKVIYIAQKTFKIARTSILLGISLSLILMVIFSTGILQPFYGAILQEVVDVTVIIYALRAHNIKVKSN